MIDINLAKSKINIIDVIQKSGITLTKHGHNYFGLCPFHSEKTASFSVSSTKQIFHCFGCGSGGDVIEFIKKYHNLDFPGALQFLGMENTTPQNVALIRRSNAKRRVYAKKKALQTHLIDKFETWVEQYKMELIEWVDVLNKALPVMTWERLCELSELIKQKSIWQYHLWLIMMVADADIIYDLYLEKNGDF